MAIIHIYQQLNLKKKLSKQEDDRQNHGYGDRFDGCLMGAGCGGRGEEVRGVRSTSRKLQNSHGDVQYSTGNGVDGKLIHMTHGHEQWWGNCLRERGVLGGRGRGGETGITVIA